MFRVVNVLMGSPLVYRWVARSQPMLGSPKRWLAVWGRMRPVGGAFFEVNPEAAGDIVIEMTEAVSEGIDGVVHEAGLYHRDWGFDLGGIVTPTHVWHGLRDRQAAHTWAECLAANISGAALTPVEGGEHFSTLVDRTDDIIDRLIRDP